MAGLSLTEFLDWSTNSGPQYLSGPEHIINDVASESYMIGEMLRGKTPDQMLQGSNEIHETLFLSNTGTFQTFKRGADVNFTNPQKDTLMKLQWRFMLDHMSWDEAEYMLQTSSLAGGGLKTKYKDMAYSKEQRQMQSTVDGLEALLWANPSGATAYAEMEGLGGQEPYSLPAFVHENTSNSGGFDSNWLNVENVVLATHGSVWDNQRRQYDYADMADVDGDFDGLFNAFDLMSQDINFRPPGLPGSGKFFEAEKAAKHHYGICCSLAGRARIMALHRLANDSLINAQDAYYGMPTWNGIPIDGVTILGTATLYTNGSGGFVSELDAAATNTGFRYYFFNFFYLNWRFHREKYFKKRKFKEIESKIGQYVQPVEIWGNLTCTSRKRQGIVFPGA